MFSELYISMGETIHAAMDATPLLHAATEHRNRALFTIMLSASHTAPVIFYEAFLLIIGYFGIFKDSIIQPNRAPDRVLGFKCWVQICLNHLVFMPMMLGLGAYPVFIVFTDVASTEVPSIAVTLWHISICVVLEDFLFYWSHRILHHPLLYKHFHKKHHEFKVLTGYAIASEYTHPLESLIGNILPVMAGPLVTKCHMATAGLWIVIRMLKTCDAHSGYAFRWSPFGCIYPLNPAERHDYHHETGLGSYGSFFLLWDQWAGTDVPFLQSVTEKRRKKGDAKSFNKIARD